MLIFRSGFTLETKPLCCLSYASGRNGNSGQGIAWGSLENGIDFGLPVVNQQSSSSIYQSRFLSLARAGVAKTGQRRRAQDPVP